MSATRDKSQKTTFVYSNLYALYRQGKEAAQEAKLPDTGRVIKADDVKGQAFVVRPFRPAEFLEKRLPKSPAVAPALAEAAAAPLPVSEKPLYVQKPQATLAVQNHALSSLKDNIKQLNDLHSRLRFMLQEIEELSKE